MKKIIITGGAGFIGSHLAEHLLQKKNKITIIDNFSTGNLNNIKQIKNKVKVVNADISKIKKDTNWRPTVSIKKGIELMLKNISLWKKAPIWESKSIAKETKI